MKDATVCEYCGGTGRISSIDYWTGENIQIKCRNCEGTGIVE